MLRGMRRCLLAGFVLIAAAAAGAGQEGVSPEKRDAVKKLIGVEGTVKSGQLVYTRLVNRLQAAYAEAMIKDLRAGGFFKGLSAEEGEELERRIKIFLEDVGSESARRVTKQFHTAESVEQVAAPVLDKYLTLDEINERIALNQTPLGRKLYAMFPEALAESTVAHLESKGAFNASQSPEAMAARMRQVVEESLRDPTQDLQEIMALATAALRRRLTADEIKEWEAFGATPSGRRYYDTSLRLSSEIRKNFFSLYGRQAAALFGVVYDEKLNEYALWLSEASRPGAPRGGPKPPPSHGTPPTVKVPEKRP